MIMCVFTMHLVKWHFKDDDTVIITFFSLDEDTRDDGNSKSFKSMQLSYASDWEEETSRLFHVTSPLTSPRVSYDNHHVIFADWLKICWKNCFKMFPMKKVIHIEVHSLVYSPDVLIIIIFFQRSRNNSLWKTVFTTVHNGKKKLKFQ